MSYRLFIFDLDGTLVDTSPGIMGTVRHVEKTLGIPPIPDEELRRFIGPPLEDSFMRYHGAAPERAKEMVACYRERYGGFVLAKELMEVKGISQERFAAIAPYVTVEKPEKQ